MLLVIFLICTVCIAPSYAQEDIGPPDGVEFGRETVLQSYTFLSGITLDEEGYVLCDRKGGRIVRITDDGEDEILTGRISNPVDVDYIDGEYWILQNDPPRLVSWEPQRGEIRILFNRFERDSNLTAFSVSPRNRNLVYVVDFSGFIYRIDVESQIRTIAFQELDNPADIALLLDGSIVWTEQVGRDTQEGRVQFIGPDGTVSVFSLIDPTGLAAGPDGSVYVSVFFTQLIQTPGIPGNDPDDPEGQGTEPNQPSIGGIYRFRPDLSGPELVVEGLSGPTSLVVSNHNEIVVIEESINSITKIDADNRIIPINQGTFFPLATRTFADGTTAYLTEENDSFELVFIRDGKQESIWKFSDSGMGFPLIELGGDGFLYTFDPLFQEIMVINSSGEIEGAYMGFYENTRNLEMIRDSNGGIALIVRNANGITVQRVNRDGMGDTVEYNGEYDLPVYIDESGNLCEIETGTGTDSGTFSNNQIAVDSNGDIWYADSLNGDLYYLRDGRKEIVAEDLGTIQDLSPDGSRGVNVTTADGVVYRFFNDSPPPHTSVSNWFVF